MRLGLVAGRRRGWRRVRICGPFWSGRISRCRTRPGPELPAQRALNESEEIGGGITNRGGLAACRPLIEHELLQVGLDLPKRCECTLALFGAKVRQALRQAQA